MVDQSYLTTVQHVVEAASVDEVNLKKVYR
jgi:hypothetical protein